MCSTTRPCCRFGKVFKKKKNYNNNNKKFPKRILKLTTLIAVVVVDSFVLEPSTHTHIHRYTNILHFKRIKRKNL